MTPRPRKLAAWAAALLVGAALLVVSGIIPVNASSGHWRVTSWLLHFTMQRSVATHSMGVEAPDLEDERLMALGAGHYDGGCRPCHGAPGQRMPRVPASMTPPPPSLGHDHGYDAAALFYVIKHGVKFTGMPAWPAPERDDEVWAVTAFVRRLPELDANAYARWVADPPPAGDAPEFVTRRCARCHGVDGRGPAHGAFPRLAGQQRAYLESALRAYAAHTRPSGVMEPIAGGLSSAQLRAAARWYARQPADLTSSANGSAAGARITAKGIPERRVPPCAHCHEGDDLHRAYPRLAGQHWPYLAQQLRLFARGVRGGGEFSGLMQATDAHALRPAEIRAVALHYASASSSERGSAE